MMHVTELIRHFSAVENHPVDVNDVLAEIRRAGHDDDIEFIGVDLDADILLGQIKIFYVRAGLYSDPVRHANIYYHRGLGTDWQRLICCKELMHLLDPVGAHTANLDDIDVLAERIGLPPEMQDPLADGFETNVDRLAEYRATAILFPKSIRDQLMPYYKENKLTLVDIARLVDIPHRYAAFVMSDVWDRLHDALVA